MKLKNCKKLLAAILAVTISAASAAAVVPAETVSAVAYTTNGLYYIDFDGTLRTNGSWPDLDVWMEFDPVADFGIDPADVPDINKMSFKTDVILPKGIESGSVTVGVYCREKGSENFNLLLWDSAESSKGTNVFEMNWLGFYNNIDSIALQLTGGTEGTSLAISDLTLEMKNGDVKKYKKGASGAYGRPAGTPCEKWIREGNTFTYYQASQADKGDNNYFGSGVKLLLTLDDLGLTKEDLPYVKSISFDPDQTISTMYFPCMTDETDENQVWEDAIKEINPGKFEYKFSEQGIVPIEQWNGSSFVEFNMWWVGNSCVARISDLKVDYLHKYTVSGDINGTCRETETFNVKTGNKKDKVTVKGKTSGNVIAEFTGSGSFVMPAEDVIVEITKYVPDDPTPDPDPTPAPTPDPDPTPAPTPDPDPTPTPTPDPDPTPAPTPDPDPTPAPTPDPAPAPAPVAAPTYSVSGIISGNYKAGDTVTVSAPMYSYVVVRNSSGSVIASGYGGLTFKMPASSVTVTAESNSFYYGAAGVKANAFIYCYDKDMNKITIESSNTGEASVKLGKKYAGKKAVLYKGKNSTSKKIAETTLDSAGRAVFSVDCGKNYSLVIED